MHTHGYGKRFIVRADEKLTAFVELQTGDTRVRGEFDLVIARAEACADEKLTAFVGLERAISWAQSNYIRDSNEMTNHHSQR